MASIKTISFGDAKFKNWKTSESYHIPFDFDKIKNIHYNIIKPKLKVKTYDEIRLVAFDIIHDYIKDGNVHTMTDLVNIIMAMRITLVDCNNMIDGFCKVMLSYPDEKYVRITFFNICWHINNHCKQLYEFCSIQGLHKGSGQQIAVSYTTGEWKDKYSIGCDFAVKKSKYHNYNRRYD